MRVGIDFNQEMASTDISENMSTFGLVSSVIMEKHIFLSRSGSQVLTLKEIV